MKVVIREAAYADLERIHTWIAQDNPRAAHSVVSRIFDTIERLGLFPGLGHAGRAKGTREWVVRGLPYIIVYTIDVPHQELTVVAVFHGAQNR